MELIEYKCASAMHLKSFFLASKTLMVEQSDFGLDAVENNYKNTFWLTLLTQMVAH